MTAGVEQPGAARSTGRQQGGAGGAGQRAAVCAVVATRGGRPVMLARAVRSIAATGFAGPLEIVVVFDGTPPVDVGVPAPAGVTIAVVANTRTPGVAGARNCGLLSTAAEYVAFCDDDDEWLPGKLTAQVALLSANPGTVMAGCGITIVSGTREFHRRAPAVITHEELLRSRQMELHSSGLVLRRADLLEKVGAVQEGLPGDFGEDYDLLLRASLVAPLLAVPAPSVRIHWHGDSYYFTRWATNADALEVLLDQHVDFAGARAGRARIEGQIAFARAATGHRAQALRWTARAVRDRPLEPRAYLALLVTTRLVRAGTVERLLHRVGRGL